jgi:tetratricopeptide (TPR) repeat protein
VNVSDLLSRGRAALAAGDAGLARTLIERALAAGPGEAEAPALELLQADALLVARRPDDAIGAYRRVARRRARAPEGETAAFAVGQLLFERGAEAEAGAALYDYLARYPHGRFVREARERLTQLDSKP